jgi:hypothetical protein
MAGGRRILARSGARRAASSSTLRKVLLTAIAIGALGSITVQRTYALFGSETQNSSASVGGGTLTFSTTVGGGSACASYGGPSSPGNVNTGCAALFTDSAAAENYPGTPRTVTVTIRNDGSLDARDLALFMPSCTATPTGDAPAPGGGDPCASGGDELYVQETASDQTTPTRCWYPVTTTTCSFGASGLHAFAAAYTSASSALDLGAGPTAQQARYFTIGVQVPTTANNNLQGEAARFLLTWHMTS